jgi:hypothetical protein
MTTQQRLDSHSPGCAGVELPAVLRNGGPPTNVVRLWGACPWSDAITGYDRRNIYIYGWLLDGDCAGVPDRDMARAIFGIDADRDPARAQRVVRSHLERARWLQNHHFPFLDW